ncbi:MAG: ABC transporter substrate-binding protein, partial [Polyangiaceae bacterium]
AMRSIRRSLDAQIVIASLVLLSGTGCSDPLAAPLAGASAGATTPKHGGTLRLASFADIRTLDPAAVSDQLADEPVQLLYAGLVDFDANGNVFPDLAEKIETSSDGLSYTFTLRPGVLFHDGTELTADDVKRSVERSLHPDSPSPTGTFYEGIAGEPEYTQKKAEHISGVTVDGKYVVTFRLSKADATFLTLLALHPLRPVCKSAGNRYSDSWMPCGAGPFKLLPGGWDRGRSLTLVRNDSYFRPGQPYLDAVTFLYNVNIVTERFKFEAGEIDAIRDLTQADTIHYLSDERWKPLGEFEAAHSMFGESMNTEMAPFDNVEVRRAVAAAINRDHLRLLRSANIIPTGHVLPPDVPGYNAQIPGQKYDYDAALEHMRKAGLAYDPKTKTGGYPHRLVYTVFQQGAFEFSAQVVQQDLAKIGIDIDIRVASFGTYLATTHRRHASAISPQGWSQDYPDASDFYESLFLSRSINDEDTGNTSFYKNPELDRILDDAHSEMDEKKRQALYDRAEIILRDDAPWAFTYAYRWYDVHQPYVHALAPHATWVWDIEHAWLDRAISGISRGSVIRDFSLGSLFGSPSKGGGPK